MLIRPVLVCSRETMLQALRGIITPAGDKMSEPLRKQVHNTLLGMLGHSEDVTRAAVAGCLGALCRWLNPDQLHTTLHDHLLCDDASMDGTLRHGRSAALSVALKEAPSAVYTKDTADKVHKVILAYLAADRVSWICPPQTFPPKSSHCVLWNIACIQPSLTVPTSHTWRRLSHPSTAFSVYKQSPLSVKWQ